MHVPVTINSKKWFPLRMYWRVCLNGPYTNASNVMLNPPCDYPGKICLYSDVYEKLWCTVSKRIEIGLGLKLQIWNAFFCIDLKKIFPKSIITGPTEMFLN